MEQLFVYGNETKYYGIIFREILQFHAKFMKSEP